MRCQRWLAIQHRSARMGVSAYLHTVHLRRGWAAKPRCSIFAKAGSAGVNRRVRGAVCEHAVPDMSTSTDVEIILYQGPQREACRMWPSVRTTVSYVTVRHTGWHRVDLLDSLRPADTPRLGAAACRWNVSTYCQDDDPVLGRPCSARVGHR
jgi:hypothetical protein